jgi:hypothetical protein
LNQSRSLASILVVFSFIILLVGLAWGNFNFSKNNIAGEGFFVQWIGIRSLVTSGNSPYSDLVTSQIQDMVQRETSFAPGNPPRYTSPIYSDRKSVV